MVTTVPYTELKLFKVLTFFLSIKGYYDNMNIFANFHKFWNAAILVYRFAVGCSTSCMGIYVKLSHVVLHLATAPCILLGAVAAMEYHRLKGLPHMYSLHSWMGLLTCILFTIQVIIK